MFSSLDRFRDHGLLLLRVGIGLMMVAHGWPKLMGGVERWEGVGGAMATFGITFAPAFWGFMAAITECAGGLLFALGLLTRPVAAMLAFTMFVAAAMHIGKGDPFTAWSHAAKLTILFVAMIGIGPGRFSLDERLFRT